MKSPMIENADYIEDKEKYSELQVLSSMGGYYVGTIYTNHKAFSDGFYTRPEPGSRDTNYFKTYQEAEDFLKELESGSKEALNKLRTHP